ncbi:Crossover junction endonuclease EME1 [Frankliniella fusca]|uniref:Crossover junction endonuclease EME1 n=1 Tax=Frankliniella fusca TaxID=407009 RepID=A0AAE1LIP9_9NEOP|nr:Crossover junction endonuclease EME1 [Frankliniella fusca]
MDNVIVLSSDNDDDDTDDKPPTNIEDDFSFSQDPNNDFLEDFDYGANMDEGNYSLDFEEQGSSSTRQEHKGLARIPESKSLVNKAPRIVHDLSDSDDPAEDVRRNQHKVSSSSDDELPDININLGPSQTLKKEHKTPENNLNVNKNTQKRLSPKIRQVRRKKNEEQQMRREIEQAEKMKQRRAMQEEREKKKKEAAHLKALKQATAEIERSKKPGECLKWVTTTLDTGLLNSDYSGELLSALRACEVEYKVEECIIPCSVTWERRIQTVHVDDNMVVQKKTTIQTESTVLIMWVWNKLIEKVHDNSLQKALEDITALLPDKDVTLVVFGLEDYFRFQKTQKRRDVRADVLGTGPKKRRVNEGSVEEAPQVSRGDVEFALAEIQINCNISHRCINNKTDMANLVCQFSKAIAEAPFKREKYQKNAERLDWYALADSKDCVVVDKDGNGSFQLWQRQLCQFPLASRETSEAIASVYPSPLYLLQAYENCSSEDAAQYLLEDIPVRRGPGPLSTTRRIGPQLSKKIHTFFTTIDDGCLIAPD